ncbi:MAG: MBL fold metallo-hydrolase [Acidobacteria bacterium]|nr:MBL fold metallo-hydrolase [Acidobacteriota bacterium]
MARVTVLGSGTCVPTRRRGPAGFVLEAAGETLLIDGGSGTLGRMVEAGLDYRQLAAVLYTHTHPDHTADLAPLLFALNYTPDFRRERRLKIIGPPDFGDFLARLTELHPGIRPKSFELEVIELGDDTADLGHAVVTARRVEHAGVSAVAYRLSVDGVTIVFSGDTTYCPAIVDIAAGADLLVIEASLPLAEHDPGSHLTAGLAGRVAAEAGARAVVLTHLYPICDQHDMAALVAQEFGGRIMVGEDLMTLDVGPEGVELPATGRGEAPGPG